MDAAFEQIFMLKPKTFTLFEYLKLYNVCKKFREGIENIDCIFLSDIELKYFGDVWEFLSSNFISKIKYCIKYKLPECEGIKKIAITFLEDILARHNNCPIKFTIKKLCEQKNMINSSDYKCYKHYQSTNNEIWLNFFENELGFYGINDIYLYRIDYRSIYYVLLHCARQINDDKLAKSVFDNMFGCYDQLYDDTPLFDSDIKNPFVECRIKNCHINIEKMGMMLNKLMNFFGIKIRIVKSELTSCYMRHCTITIYARFSPKLIRENYSMLEIANE